MRRLKLKYKKKIKCFDVIIIFSIIIIFFAIVLIQKLDRLSTTILLNYAQNINYKTSSYIINEAINNIVSKNDFLDIIDIEKDNNESIISVNFNNKKTNQLLYEISENLNNIIDKYEKGKTERSNSVIFVPFGVIYDIPLLINIGPKIPFKIDYLGSADNDITINIKEYGINNSLVEILLNINIVSEIILPFKFEKQIVSKQIIISSTIIQGKIPQYYGGLISKSSQ